MYGIFGKPLKRAIQTCMGHGGVGPLKKKLFGRQCAQVLDFGPNFYNSAPDFTGGPVVPSRGTFVTPEAHQHMG